MDTAVPVVEHRPTVLLIVPSLQAGGAERQTIALLNGLDERRIRTFLLYLKRGETLRPEVRADRLAAVWCCEAADGFDRNVLRRLVRWIDSHAVDVLVCVNRYAALYGILARHFSHTHPKVLTIVHSTALQSMRERLRMRFLDMNMLRTCEYVLYVSENQRKYWREQGLRARSDGVIHNGIDVDRFRDVFDDAQKALTRRELAFESDDYVIGVCAALRPEKAHADLLCAIARLRETGLPAKGLLIGDGPERAAIERKVVELGLCGHVVITGFKQDVRPYIACCDVMALVSHAVEAFSLAAMEAMALSKPLVMSNIGGAAEQIVHGEHGYLYPAGDIDSLATHLAALSQPAARRRMGAAAAVRVREQFTLQRMLADYERTLLALCERGRAAPAPH